MQEPERCDNCRFYQYRGSKGAVCRRYPRRVVATGAAADSLVSVYPETFSMEWCGEYRRKAENA